MGRIKSGKRGAVAEKDGVRRRHIAFPPPIDGALEELARRRYQSVSGLLRELALRELAAAGIAV
jgi:hypothetical protein